MADITTHRTSALNSIPTMTASNADVVIKEIQNLTLFQVAAWPDTLVVIKDKVQALTKTKEAITPNTISTGNDITVIWIDPLKFWIMGAHAPDLKVDIGTTLDLSHSYTHIRLSGPNAATVLNKHLPLDLREQNFPENSTASTSIHHVQIRLWMHSGAYHLLIPRGFAKSICKLIIP